MPLAPKRPRRPRAIAKPRETPAPLDLAAVSIAIWLALMCLLRLAALQPQSAHLSGTASPAPGATSSVSTSWQSRLPVGG